MDFSRQREAEERERLLYIRLHVGLLLRPLCQATGAQGAKGRRARTHGFMTPIYLPELSVLCSTSTEDNRNGTARTPTGTSYQHCSIKSPKGKLLESPLCFLFKKKKSLRVRVCSCCRRDPSVLCSRGQCWRGDARLICLVSLFTESGLFPAL